MVSDFAKRIFNAHLLHHLAVEDVEHRLDFAVDLVVEVLFVYVAFAVFLLEQADLLFDFVDLFDDFFDVGVLLLLFDFLFAFDWECDVL